MADYRFNRKHGTPFILEADTKDQAWGKFYALDGNSGVYGTPAGDILSVELVPEEKDNANKGGKQMPKDKTQKNTNNQTTNHDKPVIYLCDKHFFNSDWSDREVIHTGHASCDICQEK